METSQFYTFLTRNFIRVLKNLGHKLAEPTEVPSHSAQPEDTREELATDTAQNSEASSLEHHKADNNGANHTPQTVIDLTDSPPDNAQTVRGNDSPQTLQNNCQNWDRFFQDSQ